MVFTNKVFADIPPVNVNQTVVKRVFEHRHLGIWLTPSLCWTKQVHEVSLKANAKLAVFCSVAYLSRSTSDILYKLQICSVIDYGLCIYYSNLKQSDIYRPNQIQYRPGKLTVVLYTLHLASDWTGNWAGRTCPTVPGSLHPMSNGLKSVFTRGIFQFKIFSQNLKSICFVGIIATINHASTQVLFINNTKKFEKMFFL